MAWPRSVDFSRTEPLCEVKAQAPRLGLVSCERFRLAVPALLEVVGRRWLRSLGLGRGVESSGLALVEVRRIITVFVGEATAEDGGSTRVSDGVLQ